MTRAENLFSLAENFGIEIYFKDLKCLGYLGLYIECYEIPSMILIDNSIKNNDKKICKVLCEELGHYYTSSGDFLSDADSYIAKLKINRCEIKAERWLCHYLIPTEKLINGINKNPTSIDDLCDYLDVDIDILMSKLKFLSLENKSLALGDGNFLMLTNLPNLMFFHD